MLPRRISRDLRYTHIHSRVCKRSASPFVIVLPAATRCASSKRSNSRKKKVPFAIGRRRRCALCCCASEFRSKRARGLFLFSPHKREILFYFFRQQFCLCTASGVALNGAKYRFVRGLMNSLGSIKFVTQLTREFGSGKRSKRSNKILVG